VGRAPGGRRRPLNGVFAGSPAERQPELAIPRPATGIENKGLPPGFGLRSDGCSAPTSSDFRGAWLRKIRGDRVLRQLAGCGLHRICTNPFNSPAQSLQLELGSCTTGMFDKDHDEAHHGPTTRQAHLKAPLASRNSVCVSLLLQTHARVRTARIRSAHLRSFVPRQRILAA